MHQCYRHVLSAAAPAAAAAVVLQPGGGAIGSIGSAGRQREDVPKLAHRLGCPAVDGRWLARAAWAEPQPQEVPLPRRWWSVSRLFDREAAPKAVPESADLQAHAMSADLQAQVPPQVAVVMFGPTQAGKSTFVDFLTEGMDAIAIGDGDGESVTTDVKLYQATKLGCPAVDTPGINDSKLRFTNQEAGARVAMGMVQSGVRRVKFIVVDSLANDSVQLRTTLQELAVSFGREVLPGVLVLATKADRCTEKTKRRRLENMRKIALAQGVKVVVPWQSEDISPEGWADQLALLQDELGKIAAVNTKDLDHLHARVERKARELFEQQTPSAKQVMVTEQYTEPYTDTEEYEQEYVDTVPKEEKYTEYRPVTKMRTVHYDHQYIERGPWLGKVLTLGFGFRDEVKTERRSTEVPVESVREIERTRTIYVPQRKTRTARREVTRHRQLTREVPRTVEYLIPLEQWYDRAMAEIIKEERERLASSHS